MKKLILMIIGMILSMAVYSQNRFKISQSMETADQKEEPAQFQITLPKKDSSSWLVNLGISYKLFKNATRTITKLNVEYHRNTLTDKKQNNFSSGLGLAVLLGGKETEWFLNSDLKYIYDDIDTAHSAAMNLLFTLMGKGGPVNKFLYNPGNTSRFQISPFAGIQLQDILKAKNVNNKGFILRPIVKIAMYYDLLKKDEAPSVRFSADYTGRSDVVNNSKTIEGYTHLFKTGAEWFLAYKPFRVSLGASFNYGSDPIKGLKQQQYWLLFRQSSYDNETKVRRCFL
ncbi:MAG: hypothetical protein EOO43_13200 [Flavobacterium sp.]|nr:MAG: hypothetical protein EOO43_13200 [Flavobacterium sp.]